MRKVVYGTGRVVVTMSFALMLSEIAAAVGVVDPFLAKYGLLCIAVGCLLMALGDE